MNFNTNTENEEEWLTPPEIVSSLGVFDLDPCAQPASRRKFDTAITHYSLEETGDGLSARWKGRVWLNPPYGRKTFTWLEKLSTHRGGGIALIFARTETKGFHAQVWNKARSIFFFEGRLMFHRKDGTIADRCNAPSCLVSYSLADTVAIDRAHRLCKIKGKHVFLS